MNKILKGAIVTRFGSQFNFAHALGEHESTVSRIIRGRVQIDDTTKRKWAHALGIKNHKRLFQGEG